MAWLSPVDSSQLQNPTSDPSEGQGEPLLQGMREHLCRNVKMQISRSRLYFLTLTMGEA